MSNKYGEQYDSAASSYAQALDEYKRQSMLAQEQAYRDTQNVANEAYKQSRDDYLKAQRQADAAYGKALDTANYMYDEYAGEKGYRKALDTAKGVSNELAGSAAGQAQSQATAASRAAGLSRAQAASLGAGQAANAYGDTFNRQLNTQQQAAYGAGMDKAAGTVNAGQNWASNVGASALNTGAGLAGTAQNRAALIGNAAQNRAAGISQAYGNYATGQSNLMSSAQAERQNQYNRTWGTIGGIGSLLLSDERAKNYVPTEEMVRYLQTHGYSRGRGTADFDPTQLAIGILVEQEHGKDFAIALEIAKDHLVEDPMYYTNHNLTSEAVDRIEVNANRFKIDLSKLKEI